MTKHRKQTPALTSAMILVVLLGIPMEVSARQAKPSRDETQVSKKAKVVTRKDSITVNASAVSSAASDQTVIGIDQIDSRNVSTVGELARSVPGVSILSNGTRGGLSAIQIRGGDPNFTLVTLDGLPLNDATDQLGGVYNLEGLYPGHLGRIEIVRGPLSTFFGSQALGGVVNLTTRRGTSDRPVLEAELEGGNASHTRTSAQYSGKTKGGDFFLGAAWEREEGRIADDRFEAFHLAANWSRSVGNTGVLRIVSRLAVWQADDYPDASGGPLFGSGETRFSDNDEFSVSAHFSMEGTHQERHDFSFHFYRHQLERDSPGVFPQVPPSLEETGLSRFRAAWTAAFPLADSVQLQAGADLEVELADNESLLTLPPMFGGALRGDYSARRRTVGGFAGIVGEKDRLLYEIGLRADALEDSKTELSPRFALSYGLSQGTRLRGSLARSYKLPSFFALSSPRQLGGNAELRPESVWGGDIGLDQRLEPARLTLSASVFHNRCRDLVDFDFDQFLHVNRASVRTRGLELATTWDATDELQVQGMVTWQSVRDLGSGQALLQRPDFTGGVSATWSPKPRLELFAETWFTSEILDRQIPVPSLGRVTGYGLLNLAATWRLSENWSLRGRADNLTDNAYQTLIGFPGPGRGIRVSLRFGGR